MQTSMVDAKPASLALPRGALPLLAAQAAALSLLLIRPGQARSPSRAGPQAWPALAIGATALGALAVGALSIGALAVGRLRLRHAQLGEVHIRSLSVDTLTLPQPTAAPPTPVI